jgi:hypothetical protein
VLVAMLALTLAVAACGGGGKANGVASLSGANKPTATTSPGGSHDDRQAALDFARCMRQHGIDMPDPKFNSAPTSVPSTCMVPLLGRSSVPMMCSRVDLPDPDGPVIASISPAVTVRSTSRSTCSTGGPG